MKSDPAWSEEKEWERLEEDVDDRWLGAAGAASSSSGARREGEREVGDWRRPGEPTRYLTYVEVMGQRGVLVAEEGRAR